jgi:hypothetical protein
MGSILLKTPLFYRRPAESAGRVRLAPTRRSLLEPVFLYVRERTVEVVGHLAE